MTCLLDVNVLVALHQPRHSDYRLVTRWFAARKEMRFATCPITQAGLLRLLTQPIAGLDLYTMPEALAALRHLSGSARHTYWPDAPTYLDTTQAFTSRMQGHRQITDAYLLGLAKHHGGKLATLDKAVVALAGPEFSSFVELIQ